MMQFSRGDMQLFLRLVCGLLVWKFLSTDYTGLLALHSRLPESFPLWFAIENQVINLLKPFLLFDAMHIRIWQIVGAVFLVAWAFTFNRAFLFLGLFIVIVFETIALQYRGLLFDTEFSSAILLLVLLWPYSLRITLGKDAADKQLVGFLGITLMTYIGGVYFLTGLAKIVRDPLWPLHVRLELMYPCRVLWTQAALSMVHHSIAQGFSSFWSVHPWAATMSATIVLAGELSWWLAILSRRVRAIVPFVMFGFHFMFLLSYGTLFFNVACVALLATAPWQFLRRGARRIEHQALRQRFWWPRLRPKVAIALALSCSAWLGPAVLGAPVYPFANYTVFGWTYEQYLQKKEVFALGYYTEQGSVEFFPVHHGGFLDYQIVPLMAGWVEAYLTAPNATVKHEAQTKLNAYLNAVRPYRSNAWLLGPFTAPSHSPGSQAKPFDPTNISDLRLFRGGVRFDGQLFYVDWIDQGPVPL